MADRSWFFASQGQQQGPYPEVQFRELIAGGAVGADTLVWTEGMSGWQKAGDIPGLESGGSGPPMMPHSGGPLAGYGNAPISVEAGTWELFGRLLLYLISFFLIIPLPWVVTSLYRWLVERLRIPQRPHVAFTGNPGDIWYVFILLALCSYAGLSNVPYLRYALFPVQAVLSWMITRWFIGNLSPDGNQRSLAFIGSFWGYIGWYLLAFISFITIIGWAWVLTAWIRWICRNVTGTRREIVFNGSGWQVLWRTVVFTLGCMFIIPIPWLTAWYVRWSASQFALIERY
jgi:GYF domain 2